GLIEQNQDSLLAVLPQTDIVDLAALVADQLNRESSQPQHRVRESYSPWQQTDGWLVNGTQNRRLSFDVGTDQPEQVEVQYNPPVLHYQGHTYPWSFKRDAEAIRIQIAGKQHLVSVYSDSTSPPSRHLFRLGQHRQCTYLDPLAVTLDSQQHAGKLTAPMPGKVLRVQVKLGQRVAQPAPLLVIEAMKMEHTITAPFEGIVEAIHYEQGEQVAEGIELLTFVAITAE
ncbi:MAG: hypothetical protein NWS57_03050, partial [Burkholderiaceae bacterium]|nr:hypothetical protein [Burkholderiaceae bacterium]